MPASCNWGSQMINTTTFSNPGRHGTLPYPTSLIDVFHTVRGRRVVVRPALAQDSEGLARFYQGLTRDTLRQRFHCAFSGLTAQRVRALSDLSQVDHAHLMVLVATSMDEQGREQVLAQAGWQVVEEGVAEFALVVADAWQGQGLGMRLMQALLQGASQRNLKWLKGTVLSGNEPMLALMRRSGFWLAADRDADSAFEVQGHVPRLVAQALATSRPAPRWWARLPRWVPSKGHA
jgi:acetyltransferase